jgi:hypothetical protein
MKENGIQSSLKITINESKNQTKKTSAKLSL